MSRLVMVALVAAILIARPTMAETGIEDTGSSCPGLSVGHFEDRFPDQVRRLTLNDAMLHTFIELWNAGARPALPAQPERIVIYALPGLPLIIGYQKRHCIIAYLAVDSTVLWRWLGPRLGWRV